MTSDERFVWRVSLVGLVTAVMAVGQQASATERWVPSPNYPTIQAAIDACVDGDEVVIEPNTYTGDGNRDLDFGGKSITVRSTNPDDPNVVGATIIDCQGDSNYPDDPNYHHRGFDFHSDEGPNSVVAGLTITNGYAYYGGGISIEKHSAATVTHCTFSGNGADNGGGMDVEDATTITHCTFNENWAERDGGGICNTGYGLTVTNCTFNGNWADGTGGGIDDEGDATVTGCAFIGNTAYGGDILFGGGGICTYAATVTDCDFIGNGAVGGGGMSTGTAMVTNCTFVSNSAVDYGGGMTAFEGTVTHCTFNGNVAEEGGGGLLNINFARLSVSNSTFSGNWADHGGGMYSVFFVSSSGAPFMANCTFAYNSAGSYGAGILTQLDDANYPASATNCVFWGNSVGGVMDEAAQVVDYGTVSTVVTYSCIQDCNTYCADANDHNIGDDPLFIDPNGPDGDPNTWQDNDYHLLGGSPCINAGDPNGDYTGQTDIDGEPRVMLGRVDMGSDEYPGYTLTLKLKDPGPSVVEIEPNDPNWPAFAYPPGTELTLTAVPGGDKSFNKWKVWDANHPGDGNYITIDTNNPISIVMSADRKVKAVFKCGGGGEIEQGLPLLMVFGLLGLFALIRRRS